MWVWYVMQACMLTGDSQVTLYGNEKNAKKEFDKLRDAYLKELKLSDQEILENPDYVQIEPDYCWFNGDCLYGDQDVSISIGCQEVKR
jgi:hypothetical protein